MHNIYRIRENNISIWAPGSSDKNRIKNDMVWDINQFLNSRYHLYSFYETRKVLGYSYVIPITGFFRSYMIFQKLDDEFIERRTIHDEDIAFYRETLDPKRKMADEVFKESLCMENVDMEYVAVKDISELTQHCKESFKSPKSCRQRLKFSAPVYVSMFGAKEMEIYVNDMGVFAPLTAIITKYCAIERK